MPASYSLDLRQRVVDALQTGKREFAVSIDFVSDMERLYRESNRVRPKKMGGYRQPKIDLFGEQQLNGLKKHLF